LFFISVFDIQTNSYASGSTINSNPDSCTQATGTYSSDAVCGYTLSNPQGSERVSFNLAINSAGNYQFLAVAALGDSSGNILAHTSYAKSVDNPNVFSVSVIDKFTLTVSFPSQVSMTLDGVQQAAGSISVQLSPGTHTISAPPIVQLGSSSRLRFNGWSDGSNQTTRTFDLESDTQLTVTYVTQYMVSAATDSTLTSGWYDSGATLQLSVDQSQPLNSYRVLLGGFNGWYNGDQMVSSSPSTTVTVTGPLNLSARWNVLPYIPPVLLIAAITGAVLFLRRRKTGSRPGYEPVAAHSVWTVRSCTSCGSQIPVRATFCRKCGARQT
jgi:ribosomal protein L40E